MTSETSQISEREREILRLVAMGATNQQIANELNISVNTVKVHLRNIFGKIGAASRTEATVYAIRSGLVSVDNGAQAAQTISLSQPTLPDAPPPTLDDPALSAIASTPTTVAPAETTAPPAESVPAPITVAAPAEVVEPPVLVVERPGPIHDTPAGPPAHARPTTLLIALVVIGVLAAALAYTLLNRQPSPPDQPPAATAVLTQPDRWKVRAPLAHACADFAVTTYENKLYIIGGRGATDASAAVNRYDPANDTPVSLNDLPQAVSHVHAVTIGGRIYVPGGEAADGSVLDVFQAYDPRSQQADSLPALPAPRSRYALASFEGQLYLFGGWDGADYRAEVFIYNPATEKWSQGAPMPTARRGAGAAVAGSQIYVIGGENASGPLQVNERYDPTGADGGRWESVAPLPTRVAAPALVGFSDVINLILVFDSQTRSIYKYVPSPESWAKEGIREDITVSARAANLGTSVFIFGEASGASCTLSEYRALYTSFLPNLGQ
jgi:DNA-binding CsgD family transcriptional regulator